LDDCNKKKKRNSCDSVYQGSRIVDNLRKMLREISEKIKGFSKFIAEFLISFYNFIQMEFIA